jgi:hypothetical protein
MVVPRGVKAAGNTACGLVAGTKRGAEFLVRVQCGWRRCAGDDVQVGGAVGVGLAGTSGRMVTSGEGQGVR